MTATARFLEPVIFVLATIYVTVDAAFMGLARPIINWLAERQILEGVVRWIASLPRYPALLLFIVPLAVLEPVKPVALYLAGTGHFGLGAVVFVGGEILKLVLVERLFIINRDKLMSIPAFAVAYRAFRSVMDYLVSTPAWQAVQRVSAGIRRAIRGYGLRFRASRRPRRVSWQSR